MEDSRVIADTNILIDYFRKKQKRKSVLYSLSEKYEVVISSVSEFEFLSGFSIDRLNFGIEIIKAYEILPFDSNCAREAANIYRQLISRNRLITAEDIFIAATAIVHQLPLATFNTKHFERIRDLTILPG
jgi:predicted nucleic acid-binding protein